MTSTGVTWNCGNTWTTQLLQCVDKKEDSRIQSDVEELVAKSNQNKFQLNESKCNETTDFVR